MRRFTITGKASAVGRALQEMRTTTACFMKAAGKALRFVCAVGWVLFVVLAIACVVAIVSIDDLLEG